METPVKTRSLSGLLLGAWVGVIYGLVSTNINFFIIRDIPLRYDIHAMLATTGWSLLAGAALGLLVNLPYHALPGVVLASLAAAIGVALQGVLDTAYSTEKLFSTLFLMAYVFLPLVILFVPFNALLRWSSQQLLPQGSRPLWAWPRLKGLLLWTFLAILVGSFTFYPENARKMLRRMDSLIQTVQSGTGKNVPYEFSQVAPAVRNASVQYKLAWTDDTSTYPDPLFYEDTLTAFRLQVVSAHFQSGETIFCLFREVDGNLYICTTTPSSRPPG